MGAIKRRTVRIGTRKSRLALVQTNMVAEAIKAACPEVKCELVPLMTKGDKILKTSLVAFGGKGAFVEEFEQSILNGDIDLAVHSAKDMPMDLSDGLCIGAVLKREDPRDVFKILSPFVISGTSSHTTSGHTAWIASATIFV